MLIARRQLAYFATKVTTPGQLFVFASEKSVTRSGFSSRSRIRMAAKCNNTTENGHGDNVAVGQRNAMCSAYEDAVKTLQSLQSNAEAIAKARQNLQRRKAHAIPNMNKYIHRSGLKDEDVDKLSVIHISGTKGKGSTCAFCERILRSHGYKTGLFSSPHLFEVRERIRINGRPIPKEVFTKYFWKVYNNLKETQTQHDLKAEDGGGMPAYFAFLTVLSLHVFLDAGVDVVVVEVGIGGQYDSTNFFRKPAVCGVTSLGLDHTMLLGNKLSEIAWQKAGIFKENRPAITVLQEQSAMEVILERAKEKQSPLYLSECMSKELLKKHNTSLGIAGIKQIENASLALQLYRMWETVKGNGKQDVKTSIPSVIEDIPRLRVEDLDNLVLEGLSSCEWPGRSQTVRRGDVTYYLDGAHTKESMEACTIWFKETADTDARNLGGGVARILVFNATGDRDVTPFFTFLKNCDFDAAVFCPNTLSTVESMNRSDNKNRNVTSSWMLERMKTNKETWDSLMTNDVSEQSVGMDRCLDISQCQHAEKEFDHNSNNNEVEEGLFKTKAEREKNGPSGPGASFHSSETVPQPAAQLRCLSTLSSKPNIPSVTPDKDSLTQGPPQNQQPSGFTAYEKGILNHSPRLSLTFPCILQALEWATQGRDDIVRAKDPSANIPSVPSSLSETKHVQVLVTGSLHLVGTVLGVIMPDMND